MRDSLDEVGEEKISIIRQVVDIPDTTTQRGAYWEECTELLSEVVVDYNTIEDKHGMLQADFANKFLGGSVMSYGNVQEEIRFSVCPELLALMPFCEVMADNESLLLIGAKQYASYEGYATTFKCTGPFEDSAPLDAKGRRDVQIIAFDALRFPGSMSVQQYEEENVRREFWKCDVAFTSRNSDDRPIATGNWGCGAFGGNPR